MVEQYQQGPLASAVVGLPREDNSAAQSSAIVAKAASEARDSIMADAAQRLQKAGSDFAGAQQSLIYAGMFRQYEKRRQLVAHVNKIKDEVKFALEGQLEDLKVEGIGDPEGKHSEYLQYVENIGNSALMSVPEKERQFYKNEISDEQYKATLKANEWKNTQVRNNTREDLDLQLDRYVKSAPKYAADSDPNSYEENLSGIMAKLPAMQASWGTAAGELKLLKKVDEFNSEYLGGMIDVEPERALKTITDFESKQRISPDEANKLRGRANTRLNEIERDELNRIQTDSVVSKGELTSGIMAKVTSLEALDPLTQRAAIIDDGSALKKDIERQTDVLLRERTDLQQQYNALPTNASKVDRTSLAEQIKVVDSNISTLKSNAGTVNGMVGQAERQNVGDSRYAASVGRYYDSQARREEREAEQQIRTDAAPEVAALMVGIANAVQFQKKPSGKVKVTNLDEAPMLLDQARERVDKLKKDGKLTPSQAVTLYSNINKGFAHVKQANSKGVVKRGTLEESEIQSLIHHQEFSNQAKQMIKAPAQRADALQAHSKVYDRFIKMGKTPEEAKRLAENLALKARGQ